jgi:hypothetical protein
MTRTRTRTGRRPALAAVLTTVALGATGVVLAAPAQAACAPVAQYVVTADSLTVRADPGGSYVIGTLHRGDKFNDRGDDGQPSWRFGYAEGVGYGWSLKSGMAYSRTITVCH